MNIDDSKVDDVKIPDKVFVAIFEHQADLEAKYAPLERKNGFYYPEPNTHIDDPLFQNWLKGMFWRVTEELTEAIETDIKPAMLNWRSLWETSHEIRHFFEELSDAVHFLAAASISINLTPHLVEDCWSAVCSGTRPALSPHHRAMMVIQNMGLAANCLKNKPWKNSQMQTDMQRFKLYLIEAWTCFLIWFQDMDVTAKELYLMYCRKNMVNAFRIGSNY